MDRERATTGEYISQLSPNKVLDVVSTIDLPVVTSKQVSTALDCTQQAARNYLDRLVEDGKLKKLEVGARAHVWFPADWNQTSEEESTILFGDRREVVVEHPSEGTLARLSRFAHLVDSNQSGSVIYKIRQHDIWQAPYDTFDDLLDDLRTVLPEQSPHLEEWIGRQWARANQFKLWTHSDGYSVLEAEDSELMTNIAREKLDNQSQLYRHLSDTMSRVVNGAEGDVKRTLYDAGYPVRDQRNLEKGRNLEVGLHLNLREYQQQWINRFLDMGAGVFVGPSGSGKTVAAMGVMSKIAGETLILVPSRELATQWRDELTAQTTLDPNQIGEYHGGNKKIRPVTIATYHTAGMDRHRELFDERDWGLIIYDEVHHIPASIYRRSADLQAKHRLGLTATPVREVGDEKEIFTLIGPPIGTDWSPLFGDEFVQKPDVEIRYVPWASDNERQAYRTAEGHDRLQIAGMNSKKVEEIQNLREDHADEKTLIFVEWLDQGRQYAEELGYPFISGEMPHSRRDELFTEFRRGDRQTLIISRVGDEGIDLPDAEVAIVASGLGGSRRQGAQRAGRTMRPTGNSRMYMIATRGSKEEDFAQRQMQHLVEKGVRVSEVDV